MDKTILEQLKAFDKEMASSEPVASGAKERVDFSKPIPEGTDYKVRVLEMGKWEQKKGAYVILKNADGVWVDNDGNPIERGTRPVRVYDENVEFLTLQLNLEIVEGEHKGRRVYHNIDTIPEDAWKVSELLAALNVSSVSTLNYEDIKDTHFLIDIKHGKAKERVKTKVDQATGLQTEEKITRIPMYVNNPRPIVAKTKIKGGGSLAGALAEQKEQDDALTAFLLEDF